jgi:teichuronic acid biosynthesis glycosyltransferase TuaG
MPAYNAEKTIEQSIASVIKQTFTDWELIIINDGSKDRTGEIIKKIAQGEPRIQIFDNEENKGVAASRNRGVAQAGKSWVAFLDSDDLWREDKLEKQLRFMQETNADISYTGTSYIKSTGECYRFILHVEQKLSYKNLLKRNLMSCSSVMVRRDIIKRFPFAADNMSEDYATWMLILRETGFAYGLDEPLLIYRISGGSKSGNRFRSGKMHYNAYKYVGYGTAVSLLLSLRYVFHSLSKRIARVLK